MYSNIIVFIIVGLKVQTETEKMKMKSKGKAKNLNEQECCQLTEKRGDTCCISDFKTKGVKEF